MYILTKLGLGQPVTQQHPEERLLKHVLENGLQFQTEIWGKSQHILLSPSVMRSPYAPNHHPEHQEYWALSHSERTNVAAIVNRIFKESTQIVRNLDPENPKDKPWIRVWLALRDIVMRTRAKSPTSTLPTGPVQTDPQQPTPTPISTARPTAIKSVSEWREMADKLFINYKRQVPGRLTDVDAKELNRRITASYAEMYLSRPAVFKWAGMAAFASAEVGRGMHQAWQLGFGNWALSSMGTTLIWIGGLIKTGSSIGPMFGKKLFWALSGGNRFVWWDIFWQHLAYREGGIAALVAAHKAGELPAVVLAAWQSIDTGYQRGDAALVWQGNRELLKYEQEVVLQVQVYDQSQDLWPKISNDVPSPVPGHKVKFTSYVPGGNIGKFKDRWKWIEESMLPAWMALETSQPTQVRSMVQALR